MKKLLWIAVALSLALASPLAVQGQEPTEHKTYLPFAVTNYCGEWPTMSDWFIVVPESTVNLISHPSVEDAAIAAFVAVNGATRARSSAQSRWGLYSLAITPHAANLDSGVYYQVTGTATTTYTFSVWVHGTLGAAYTLRIIDGVPVTLGTTAFTGTGAWQLVEVTGTTAANTTVRCHLTADAAGGAAFYADGWQLEANAYRTTYCDGEREGCEWLGAEHTSTSQRSAQSRAGGRVRDLQTVYSLDVGGMVGAGMAPQTLAADEYALLPGGEVSGFKTHMHPFTLTGVIRGTSYADLHAKRQALVLLFDPDGVPPDADGPQPVRLRYTGATVEKEIAVHYETGLEGNIRATEPCFWERVAIRFLADDPFWYEIGESAQVLDSNDNATFRIVAGRLRSTGQWDPLGPPAAPGTAVYTFIHAIAEDDTYYYIGGDFTNFNNNGNADYIVRRHKQTGAWSALGTGMDGIVYALTIGTDGTLYVGGNFTTAGGVGAPAIAQWDPVAEAWAAVGVGLNAMVHTIAIGHDGNVYIGGEFTDISGGGLAAANYVVMWDPIAGAFSALATGFDDHVRALAIGLDGTLYAGGDFLNAGAVPVVRIAQWDGSAWSALEATGLNAWCYALAVSADGTLYVGGGFTTAGPTTVNYIAQWNGTAWSGMDNGMEDDVWGLSIGPDGMLYAAGDFTQAGSITLANRAAKWNGSSWAHLDINFPGNPSLRAILASRYSDPVIERNYDLIVGFNTSGTAYYAGTATATNGGTETAYPQIIVERAGGTSATLEESRNETTGRELLYDYGLSNGEELTTDLAPTEKSIVSSMFGDRMDAILPGCDFGSFALQPGANQVTCFVAEVGGPTVTAYLLFRDKYNGYD